MKKRISTIFLTGIMLFSFAFIHTQAATNTLPATATVTDLQDAIDNASNGDTIQIQNDINYSGIDTVTIPTGKQITIESAGSTIKLIQDTVYSSNNNRHFEVEAYGELTLNNIVLDGNSTGGGISLIITT